MIASKADRRTQGLSEARRDRLFQSARNLNEIHAKIKILQSIRWGAEVRERFFADGERELPRGVRYRTFDADPILASLAATKALCPVKDPIDAWLRRTIGTLETSALLLAAAGTADFHKYSRRLYGEPTDFFPGTERSPVELARRLIRTADRVSRGTPDPPAPRIKAGEVAEEIRSAVRLHFGDKAPQVEVVRDLAARASASPSKIRLRKDVRFSDLDARQLIQHEAFVHVATSLNGRAQRKLPLLAANHAGTTRTQEGIAVFAELISGALDPQRFLRLAHRVIAIQMAIEGADFLQVYRYFQESSQNNIEAFESTVRVFRGGLLRGGAPFTKDMVYLDGLCRVHVFIRAAIDSGRIDCLPLLFTGKLDLADVQAVAQLRAANVCSAPRFVPPWVEDPRRLVAYFAVTDVIGHASVAGLRRHYSEKLRGTPRYA